MTDLTEGQRLYAIGDVHGRLDLLDAVLARIRADLARAAASARRGSSASATTSIAGPTAAASSRR